MREEQHFRKIAPEVRTPIRVIHGENDPTPISGVVDPVKSEIADFKWYGIPKCGHDPWKEKYARSEFWRIVRAELTS